MPSIELFNPHAHPDGWHNVRSPGGYEWWYFDAEDATTDTQVVAIFMQGFIFDPGYLRKYGRFLRKPTKHLPPVAADFPSVYLCLYRGGKVDRQFFTQYPRDAFRASSDRVDVMIGPNRLMQDSDGVFRMSMTGTPWKLTARGPQMLEKDSLSAELSFTARHSEVTPAARPFLSSAMTGAQHDWVIAAPRCDVTGIVAGGGSDSASALHFKGDGYHDHNYGTAPIGDGLARWTWGRAFFGEDRVITFHHAEPKVRSLPLETHLIEADRRATREIAVNRVIADWSLASNPAMRLKYLRTLDFGPALRLSEPRIIDPTPFYLRLQFKAESFGETSTAFCEIAYPHRVRWPILGRMIEMSFDKRR